jgi:hypothetical protein
MKRPVFYDSIQHNGDASPEGYGYNRLALRTGRFTSGEVVARFPVSIELGGLQSRSGLFGEVFCDCWESKHDQMALSTVVCTLHVN